MPLTFALTPANPSVFNVSDLGGTSSTSVTIANVGSKTVFVKEGKSTTLADTTTTAVAAGSQTTISKDASGPFFIAAISAGAGQIALTPSGGSGGSLIKVDGSTTPELDLVSTPVVPADIGAEPAATFGTTGQFWRGDKSWADPKAVTPNVQGGSYTVVLSDAGKVIEFTGSSAAFFVLPTNASVPFPVGTVIEVYQAGTGQVNIGGQTVRSRGGLYNTAGQYATAAVRYRGSDEWVLTGDVA